MSYVKPFQVVQDFYLAETDWNGLQANQADAHGVTLAVGHILERNVKTHPPGRHKAVQVAHAVVHLNIGVSGDQVSVYTDGVAEAVSGTFVVTRFARGQYFVGLEGLRDNLGTPFAIVTPEQTGIANIRECVATFDSGTSNGSIFIGFNVALFEWDGSSIWDPADFSFSLAAYSGGPYSGA